MKAIVVIDMPKDCANCELKSSLFCAINGESLYTTVIQNEDKPTWCPLKPMPEKYTDMLSYDYDTMERGWNDCIDEILGEENE